MTGKSEPKRFWTGPRLVAAPLLLGLLLVLLRFGPGYVQRWRNAPASLTPSINGVWRPLAPIESLVARGLARYLVESPPAGENMTPTIRYEQPWPEWLFLGLMLLGSGLIFWLYQQERAAPPLARGVLALIRITLLLLTLLFLAEATLSVERTGLPVFAILIDDSASGQIVDPYQEAKTADEAAALARVSGRPKADRLGVGLGWLLRDDAAFLKQLSSQQRIKFYRVSDRARTVAEVNRPEELPAAIEKLRAMTAQGEESRLGDDVRQVLGELRGSPPTALLLLSDGQTTDGAELSEAAEAARKDGVPLFAIGLGDEHPARDLAIADLQVDEVGFVGDAIRFEFRLSARGFDPGQGEAPDAATVTLKRRKANSQNPDDLEILDTVRVPLGTDGKPQRAELSHKPEKTGTVAYVLDVETRPRELQTENNRIERAIEIRDQKLKVLYIEGEPRWEFRYLKTYLERDNTVDLSVVLLSSDDRYAAQDRSALPEIPNRDNGSDGIFQYDAIILGDVDPSLMNAQRMQEIAEFVTQKGGGLLFIAGEVYNPLAYKGKALEPLLPIRLVDARNPASTGIPVEPYHPFLTPEGRASPIFRLADDEASSFEVWTRFPLSLWYFEAPRKQPTAVVLMEHPSQAGVEGKLPLLLYQYAGAGKVVFSAIDDTWRWRLRVGDRYFGRYWVQMLRFLARSKLLGQKQVEVAADRARYPRNQPIQLQVRMLNPSLAQGLKSVSVQVESDSGPPRTVALRPAPGSSTASVFEASVSGLVEGKYRVRYLPPPVLPGELPGTEFQVDPPADEFVRIELNRAELTSASSASGGAFFRWDEKTRPVEVTPAAGTSGAEESNTSASDGASSGATTRVDRTLGELLPVPQKVPLDSDPPIALWNTWPLFTLFLVLLTIEWIGRRRLQLP